MLQGSLVALVTPMHENGSIAWEALEQLIEHHIAAGSDGLVVAGTTGEASTLTMDEHASLFKQAVAMAAGRIPIIAGTGANATAEAIALSQAAAEAGAAAALSVTPYYVKPTQEGLYLHYRAIVEASGLPHILYNVPSRTACDMLPETVARLRELPLVIGIKEAVADMARIDALRTLCGPGFLIFSGDDQTMLDALAHGAQGVISVSANVVPQAMHQLCQAAAAGRWDEARAMDQQLQPLHKVLFVESNPIPVKWALEQQGLIPPGIRLPLTRLATRWHETVATVLQQCSQAKPPLRHAAS
jgi:4-hydroxy-tetrahydrodipicolinate synthase